MGAARVADNVWRISEVVFPKLLKIRREKTISSNPFVVGSHSVTHVSE
jgi:hypothetical protein